MNINFQELYEYLQPYCYAIYLGGSEVLGFINHPHDHDIILFTRDKNKNHHIFIRTMMAMQLNTYLQKHNITNAVFDNLLMHPQIKEDTLDFIQIRSISTEERAYGSYINKLMIKLAGNNVDFLFDVIDTDRKEYINTLKQTIEKLNDNNKPLNPKRWYQVYTGLCIVLNKSYTFTEEQKKNINILHDMDDSTLEYRLQLQQEIQNILKDLQ